MLTNHEHNRHWTRKHGKSTFQRNCGTTSMRMYHAQFKKGSIFPSKIALYSHVPSVFPYIFPVHHICLPPAPHHQHPPSKRIYRDLVVPTFPKTCSSPLVPYDISPLFPCSPKPPGHPQYVHIEKSHAICIRRWTPRGYWKHLSVLAVVLYCFFFLLSRVIMFNSMF